MDTQMAKARNIDQSQKWMSVDLNQMYAKALL